MLLPFGLYAGLAGSNMMTGTKTSINPFTDPFALAAIIGVLLPTVGAITGTIAALRRGLESESLIGVIALFFALIANTLLIMDLIQLAASH